MKVIRRDNLNRDYHPESLVTVAIFKKEAELIAETLNTIEGEHHYCVVEDSYVLDTSSQYDVAGAEPEDEVFTQLFGLRALYGQLIPVGCVSQIENRLRKL